jgi:hypothetical protein
MARDIDEPLGSYRADDYTVRLCGAVCRVVPFAPDLQHYGSLAEALTQTDPKAKRPVLDRARELTNAEDAQRTLWMASAMDTADSGISAFSGIKTVVALYRSKQGERLAALETDSAQAADAVLKALALAYMIHRLFPGGPVDKVQAFRATKSGQALAFYYAAIEVGLPFADNALVGGGTFLSDLYERLGPEQADKLAVVAGEEAAEGAKGVMAQLLGPLDGLVKMASTHLSAIADAATTHLPTALDVGDKAAGLLATGADAMPVYRYLGTRLVAEVCVARSLSEVGVGKPAGTPDNPALDEVKYTIKKAGRDDIQVPAPARRGGWCFLFTALVATTGMTAMGGLAAVIAMLLRGLS